MKTKKKLEKFAPQYLVNEKGVRVGVQLSVKEFDALIEEIEDLHDIIRAEKIIKKRPKLYTLEEVERSILGKSR